MKDFRIVLLLLFIGIPGFGTTQNLEKDRFDHLRSRYSVRMDEVIEQYKEVESALFTNYFSALVRLEKSLQKRGDYENSILVKKEIDAVRGGLPGTIDFESGKLPGLDKLRDVFQAELEKIISGKLEKTTFLQTSYLQGLNSLKSEYTKAGNMKTAAIISEEEKQIDKELRESAPPKEKTIQDLPAELRRDLIAWFPLDEQGTTEVNDLGMNQLKGTLDGTKFISEGKNGGSRLFNGTSDRISLGNQIPDAERITISVWVKYSGAPGKGGIFSDYTGQSGNDLFISFTGSRGMHLRADKNSGTPRKYTLKELITFPEALTTEWHHLAWTMGGRGSEVYLDGNRIERISNPGSNEGFHGAYIGYAWDSSGWSFFEGQLDEFMIWSRELTEDEIRLVASPVSR